MADFDGVLDGVRDTGVELGVRDGRGVTDAVREFVRRAEREELALGNRDGVLDGDRDIGVELGVRDVRGVTDAVREFVRRAEREELALGNRDGERVRNSVNGGGDCEFVRDAEIVVEAERRGELVRESGAGVVEAERRGERDLEFVRGAEIVGATEFDVLRALEDVREDEICRVADGSLDGFEDRRREDVRDGDA